MFRSTTLLVILAFLCAQAPLIKKHHRVEFDGQRYRVLIKPDGAFEVANKAFITVYDAKEQERQREALRMVTGCTDLTVNYAEHTKLTGRIKCPVTQEMLQQQPK